MKHGSKYLALVAIVGAIGAWAAYDNGSRLERDEVEPTASVDMPKDSTLQPPSTQPAPSTPDLPAERIAMAPPTEQATEIQMEVQTEMPADTLLPLADYPGFGHDMQADEARFEQEEMQREQMISACMRELGHEYTPAPSIVVEADNEQELEAALAAAANDPNDQYVASLAPAQREAYYVALTGVPDPNAQEAADLPNLETGGGCIGEALRAVAGVYAMRQKLREQYDAMESAIAADPHVLAAQQGWSRCMQARGFDFGSPASMHEALDGAIAESFFDEEDASQPSAEELETKQAEALAAGKVCDSSLSATVSRVRVEYEQAFVKEHSDVLNADRRIN